MFSGIVEELGKVRKIASSSWEITANVVLQNTKIGDSISVNGVCLTVTTFNEDSFTVDVTPETTRRSNLELLRAGSVVNLERSLRVGDRIGGHFVEGHVDSTAKVSFVKKEGNSYVVTFTLDAKLMRYIVEKGYVAIDGMSLTVVNPQKDCFSVAFIPHTFMNTVAKNYSYGTVVNIEVDILAKYIENFTTKRTNTTINREFLNENGFM
ncbi:riboflavin synthase [Candidatus Uabimicrobium amorphum]|uniref:Riboflavin synthase n=1 Tax=Uabimicrobium amorphum TaxID=2596890 RepID=A0A5S9IIT5_UABAM|nr:riboflavin synthase [Candidatus Uabimicrobium amorphum]BBM82603.1 riboflavin synthase subunit alpha [Candidatus Uabimicrobium amorphum]